MFSYTGLSEAQSLHLINVHHIHMLKNGRIAMVGLTTKNINYVAEAINDAVTKLKWSMLSELIIWIRIENNRNVGHIELLPKLAEVLSHHARK